MWIEHFRPQTCTYGPTIPLHSPSLNLQAVFILDKLASSNASVQKPSMWALTLEPLRRCQMLAPCAPPGFLVVLLESGLRKDIQNTFTKIICRFEYLVNSIKYLLYSDFNPTLPKIESYPAWYFQFQLRITSMSMTGSFSFALSVFFCSSKNICFAWLVCKEKILRSSEWRNKQIEQLS